MEGTLAVIWMFASNFAPRNWAYCDGQLLPISQNTALFSLIGTIYGGDGRTTFQLPEMRGRVPMHAGTGPGLSTRPLGQRSGLENVTLTVAQMPQHSHPTAIAVTNQSGEEDNPAGQIISNHSKAFGEDASLGQNLGGVTAGNAGSSTSHTNLQPYMAVHFVICIAGLFPSRN